MRLIVINYYRQMKTTGVIMTFHIAAAIRAEQTSKFDWLEIHWKRLIANKSLQRSFRSALITLCCHVHKMYLIQSVAIAFFLS